MRVADEDEREEFNLVELNMGVLKGLASGNQETLSDIESQKSNILQRYAYKTRNQFGFMKKPILVTSILDILPEDKWKSFASDYAHKLADEEFNMVCILSSPEIVKNATSDLNQIEMEGVDMIMITQEKICKICVTIQETAILWSDSSDNGGSPNKDNAVRDQNGQ